MNIYFFASVENMWHLAGWTMIHYLWLGTLVAIAALLSRWLLRRASANVRYVTALACLTTLATLPVAIAMWLHQNPPPFQGGARGGFVGVEAQVHDATLPENAPIDLVALEPIQNYETLIPTAVQPATAHTSQAPATPTLAPANRDPLALAIATLNTSVHYLPWLWLIGTPITFALTATGLIGTRRLRRASRPIADGPIVDALEKLAASLRLTRRVAVAVCDRIAAPVLIGILRPIILLPPAALTGYSLDEIEMVFLHELAHVRRWDNLVNLIQRLVESLLFFHPAVWLISSWVRRERESCCDALVVTRTDRPHAYAELLVALAAQMPRSVLFHPAASSAMAAGPLRSRIRRILKLDDDPMLVSGKSFALVLGGLILSSTLAVFYVPSIGQANESATETTVSTEKKGEKNKEQATNYSTPEPALIPFKFVLKPGDSGKSKLFMNDQPVGEDVVRNVFSSQGKYVSKLHVSLSAEKGIAYADVMKVIDLLESLGVKKLALDTRHVEVSDGQFKALFTEREDNPIQTRTHDVHPSLRKTMPDAFEGWQKDPYGPQVKFDAKWDADRSRVEITAPEAAQDRFAIELKAGDPGANRPIPEFVRRTLASADSKGAGQGGAAAAAKPNQAKFPSLEDQKLADVAYKRLGGLELEPVGEEDLKRVKALGYNGGVKVASGSAGLSGLISTTIQSGDILVGLHVWPTTNMKEVAEILERDDLGELNPLKFYIVRKEQIGPPAAENPNEATFRDILHTGRVSVQIGGGGFGRGTREHRPATPAPTLMNLPTPTLHPQGTTPAAPRPATSDESIPGPQPAPSPYVPLLTIAPPTSPQPPLQSPVPYPAPALIEPQATLPPAAVSDSRNSLPQPLPALPGEPQPSLDQSRAHPLFLAIFSDPNFQEPMSTFANQLQELKRQYPGVLDGAVVNVQTDARSAESYNVKQVPMYILYHKRKEKARLVGQQTTEQLQSAVEKIQKPRAGAPALVEPQASLPPIIQVQPTFHSEPSLGPPMTPQDEKRNRPVYLVLFYHPDDSEPRDTFETQLEILRREFPGLLDGAVMNVEKDAAVAEAYKVQKFPTYILYHKRKEMARLVGRQTTEELQAAVQKARTRHDSTAGPSPTPTVDAQPVQPAMPKRDAKTTDFLGTVVLPLDEQPKVADRYVAPSRVNTPSPAPADPTQSPVGSRRRGVTLTPAESVFIAYDIPSELKDNALRYFTKSNVRSMADDRGRYIVQSTKTWHDHFAALLKATPKWRDPAAAKERAAAPLVMKKIGDEEILEWRSVGLSFKRNTENRNFVPPSQVVAAAEVAPGSPAAWADIRPGDVLTEVGSFNAGTMPEVQSLLKALGEGLQSKKEVRVKFVRQTGFGMSSVTADFILGPEDLSAKPAEPQDSKPPADTPARPAAVDKAKIRYDGKNFEQWQTLWYQADPDPNRKIKALDALEAFADAGLQREANGAIMSGLYSDSPSVAQRTRQYFKALSKSDAGPVVDSLLSALKSDLSPGRRISALRGLAAIGPNAESALPALEESLARKNPSERIAAATAIKRIVGKDRYQKPVADVLGEELGIKVVETGGVWAALPRDNVADVDAFNKFTEDVISEQELLFPPEAPKRAK